MSNISGHVTRTQWQSCSSMPKAEKHGKSHRDWMRVTQVWNPRAATDPAAPAPTYAALQERVDGLRLVCDRELDGGHHRAAGVRRACTEVRVRTVGNQDKITAVTVKCTFCS